MYSLVILTKQNIIPKYEQKFIYVDSWLTSLDIGFDTNLQI